MTARKASEKPKPDPREMAERIIKAIRSIRFKDGCSAVVFMPNHRSLKEVRRAILEVLEGRTE